MKKNLLLITILVIAFMFRVCGIWYDLPEIYTTEEYKVVNYALRMAAVRSLNPEFFNYPSLYLYFTLFVSGIIFVTGKIFGIFHSPTDFAYSFLRNPGIVYIPMRFFSSLWSTLCVLMVYLLGKELVNKKVGIIAAVMLTFIPSVIISSHEIRPNIPSLFFVLVSLYFFIKFYNTGECKNLYYSCIFSGIASSIFYNALPMFMLVLIGYSLYYKKFILFDKKLFIGMLLGAGFFLLGTPFAVLDYKTFLNDFLFHSRGALSYLPKGILGVLENYIFISNEQWRWLPGGFIKSPLMGIICFSGIFLLLKETEIKYKLLLIGIILFSLPVSMYHVPGGGYMFPGFCLFLLSGAYLVAKIKPVLVTTVLTIAITFPACIESSITNYYYLKPDVRNIAKKWIEQNIPYGSKILVDIYSHSPQVKETKKQLEKLYLKAVELNHYKKEYLKFQLEIHPGDNYGYEIYRILRPEEEVSGTVELVKEAQKVQDLIDVSIGIDGLRKIGVEYVIVNSKDEHSGLNSKNVAIRKFYEELPKNSVLIKEFLPETKFSRGPGIRIYKI